MTRFFVDQMEGNRVHLNKEDSHHLLRVMRAEPGTPFTVLAGGMQHECRLTEVENGYAVGEVVTSCPAAGEPPVHITLFQGLAKGEKLESVIQHGTEVGISQFVPVASSRSVVKLEAGKAVERVNRWQRIAREAAEQCRRGSMPQVLPVTPWREAAARSAQFDLALVPWEEGGESLKTVLADAGQVRSVAIFIGPEGGLSAEEVELARKHGARPVTLGPRILRTETAGLVAATAILYALGDLG
ncbi:MAG: 16S rRNA (uracil(1498)-N(3))-methyltransferase [Mycobacterium leprae]